MAPLVRDFQDLETIARKRAVQWGFEEIRTPTFEEVAVFSRSVGETSDIVEKEMYSFSDKGERTLALRPEGTAGVVRAYLEHNLHKTQKKAMLFYIANMFRAERPQAGRYREFEQIGFEIIGDPTPYAEVELVTLAEAIFSDIGLQPPVNPLLIVNSLGCPDCRTPYREDLRSYLKQNSNKLCEDCVRRLEKNPLRALDCKVCSGALTPGAPTFTKCANCQEHDRSFIDLLTSVGITTIPDPAIVRGLDYYTRSVFEFKAKGLGSQSVICGGGRYDGLVQLFGGPAIPAVGLAIGVNRTIMAAQALGAKPAPTGLDSAKVFLALASQNSKAATHALSLAQALRRDGKTVVTSIWTDSMKSQLRQADKSGARWCAVIGDEELVNRNYSIKDFSNRQEHKVDIDSCLKLMTAAH